MDFIIDGVHYQAKRGWGSDTFTKTEDWLKKVKADGAQTVIYITPGGIDAVPKRIKDLLANKIENPFGTVIAILDVAVP